MFLSIFEQKFRGTHAGLTHANIVVSVRGAETVFPADADQSGQDASVKKEVSIAT